MDIPDPHQICSAPGWRAVYKHRSDGSLFTAPLAFWGLIKDCDPFDLILDPGNTAIVGFVAKGGLIYPAHEVEWAGSADYRNENPAIFAGYLGPGEELTKWEFSQ